jgi:FOG: GAF domain
MPPTLTGFSLTPATVDAIRRLTRTLASAHNEEEQIHYALETAIGATESAGGSVLLHDPDQRDLRFVYSVTKRGESADPPLVEGLVSSTLGVDEGIAGRVFRSGCGEYVNDPGSDPDFARHVAERVQIRADSLAAVPILIPGGPALGVMQLINKEGGYDEEDLQVLSIFANLVALAIVLREAQGVTG